MPRKTRKNMKTEFFHIIVQGINKGFIFNKPIYMEKYKKFLIESLEKYKVMIFAYCIMGNHAHLLIHSESITELSEFMHIVNTKYAIYFNKKENRVGYVFRDRFESEPICNERYLLNCIAYIHLNPVEAKIVEYPWQYRFSSFNEYISKNGFINDDTIKKIFGNLDYLEMFYFVHFGTYNFLDSIENKILNVDSAKNMINDYLIEKKINTIINNNEEIINLSKEMKKRGISYSLTAKILNIDKSKMSRILKNEK
jgi:REP element-mobilizing transposase RayT